MNNWRLLLLAVVAVLQPIDSFTERNFIDGRQECCDHRSNSISQDTRLYDNYHKSNTEDRRLNTQEDIREARHYDARNDPIIRSRERLTVETAQRRISEKPVRSRKVNRLTEQERLQSTAVDTRDSLLTRYNQNRRIRERSAGDASSNYQRDTLHSRGINRVTLDDARTIRIENKRLYTDTFDSRDARRVQNSEGLRISTNRETMVILKRENNDVAPDIQRDSRSNGFRLSTRSQLDNNRERRIVGNRRLQSLNLRVKGQEGLMSRIDSRRDQRNIFRAINERVDERRHLDQERVSSDRISTIRRLSIERMSEDGRRWSRDTSERIQVHNRETEDHNIERTDERRQQRDESRISRERVSMNRRSRINPADESRQSLARETRFLNANTRFERIVRNSERMNERKETDRSLLPASRDSTIVRSIERREDSRILRTLTMNARDARLVRITDNRRDERLQQLTRSLDRVLASTSRESRNIEPEQNSRVTARLSERYIREVRPARFNRDIRNMERLDERRQQRDESRLTRDHTLSSLRESRTAAERRQELRHSENLLRGVVHRARGDIRENDKIDTNHRVQEMRVRASSDQTLTRKVQENERRQERGSSRTSRFAQYSSAERNFRAREHVKGERSEERRDIRDGDKQSSERIVARERLTRDVPVSQRRYDTRSTSQVGESRTRNFDSIRNERRVVRERSENEESRIRISLNQVSRERIAIQRHVARETRESRVDTRNAIATRHNKDVRISDRFDVRRQRDVKRSARENLASRSAERSSRDLAARDFEIKVRAERLSRHRDEMKSDEREVRSIRYFRAIESGTESRMTQREVQTNRQNSVTERPANRETRGVRLEARSSVLDKNTRVNTRHVIDSRFRNYESKIYSIDPVEETSEMSNAMNWQMIFYTLQGAYLCGILMQMLTEKSNEKSRNFTWWVSSATKLVKVD